MKTTTNYILSLLAPLIIVYFMVAFYNTDMDFTKWAETSRMSFLIYGVLCSVITTFIYHNDIK